MINCSLKLNLNIYLIKFIGYYCNFSFLGLSRSDMINKINKLDFLSFHFLFSLLVVTGVEMERS